ncbi:Derlin-1 [Seminavis robusta]|uniref:Derlin n=1 Tax=Seminavis robusta TaxID=568900 RepID=A0A9N8E8P2_9STRA|nr:Derlin-1 [Seminavis robusta]|eukprot:Sro670_g184760.1 Derlin-1 (278) ;mRNA; f:50615-51660
MPVAAPADNVQNAGEPTGPDAWFNSLPIITRAWFGITLVLTLVGNFGILSPYYYLWNWDKMVGKFEVWRVLTSFCYAGGFDFNTLIAMYTLVTFSKNYETGGPFNTGAGGGTADYAFAMLFGAAAILGTYPLLLSYLPPLFCRNMIYFVLYIWSRRHPTSQANIWGIPMKAIYLPFAYLALTIFMGNPYFDQLHGMVIGHLFYFLAEVVPQVYGKDLLRTPLFLIDYFGVGNYIPAAPTNNQGRNNPWANPPPAANNEPRRGGGYNWGGGGRALGRD